MTTTMTHDADTVAINTIRALCMDAIQKANSGHPGTPMGVAPVAYTLWQRFLRFDPGDPIWPNRDRFVLSEGHASALLWSLLHLSGVQAVKQLLTKFGFTPDRVAELARDRIAAARARHG